MLFRSRGGDVRGTPVISHVPLLSPIFPVSFQCAPTLPDLIPEDFLETQKPRNSRRPPEHLTHRQAPLPGTPLYSPLPCSFLCTCHVILAGFPQSILFGSSLARSVVSSPCLYILFLYILFGSSLASLSDFLSTARLPLHLSVGGRSMERWKRNSGFQRNMNGVV